VSSLSTHVLDSATGRPAEGMAVALESYTPDGWTRVGRGRTDADGRLKDWGGADVGRGHHRLVFDTGAWFAARDRECFYPEVSITFAVTGSDPGTDPDSAPPAPQHYHVPLLLAPFAYSTYRGS